jgi:hypothetical protein
MRPYLKKLTNATKNIETDNIKTAKAFRTISFEASCMMAGIPPIEIVIEEKARMYEIKHNTGRYEHECDTPLPLK